MALWTQLLCPCAAGSWLDCIRQWRSVGSQARLLFLCPWDPRARAPFSKVHGALCCHCLRLTASGAQGWAGHRPLAPGPVQSCSVEEKPESRWQGQWGQPTPACPGDRLLDTLHGSATGALGQGSSWGRSAHTPAQLGLSPSGHGPPPCGREETGECAQAPGAQARPWARWHPRWGPWPLAPQAHVLHR